MRKILFFILLIIITSKTVFAVVDVVASPSSILEENVVEVRNAVKEAVKEVKDKIEKKSYVGDILEITDTAIVITNFRGKQRVRLLPDSIIINALKKQIKANALEVDNKIIAIGNIAENEVLEAKRIVVVEKPKILPLKKKIVLGNIEAIDSKFTTITINSLAYLLAKDSKIITFPDQTKIIKTKDLKINQKVLIVYLENTDGKPSQIKTIFVIE